MVDEQGNIVPAAPPKPFWQDPNALKPVLAMVQASPSTFANVVTKDLGLTSMLVRTNLSGSRRIEHTLERIRAWRDEHFPAEVPVASDARTSSWRSMPGAP